MGVSVGVGVSSGGEGVVSVGIGVSVLVAEGVTVSVGVAVAVLVLVKVGVGVGGGLAQTVSLKETDSGGVPVSRCATSIVTGPAGTTSPVFHGPAGNQASPAVWS